jgi:hypothetical protein
MTSTIAMGFVTTGAQRNGSVPPPIAPATGKKWGDDPQPVWVIQKGLSWEKALSCHLSAIAEKSTHSGDERDPRAIAVSEAMQSRKLMFLDYGLAMTRAYLIAT